MHHCLSVDEILSRICAYIYEDVSPEPTDRILQALGDLNALARVNKTLSPRALDTLWCTQWSLGPLVSCLPSATVTRQPRCEAGNWKDCRVVALQSTPLAADFETIAPYALRIRHLAGPSPFSVGYFVDQGALTMLLSAFPTPLLPNLSTASHLAFPIGSSNRLYSMWFECVLTSKIRQLVLKDCHSTSTVKQMVRKSPALTNLSITCSLPDPIGLVSTLRNLESIDLKIESSEGFSLPPCSCSFSCLRDLKFGCKTEKQIVEIVSAIEAKNLQLICIATNYDDCVVEDEPPILTSVLSQQSRWTLTLQSITIAFPPQSPFQLEPLFAFPNLKCLGLLNVCANFTESTIKDIVRTWPLLEKFSFRLSPGWRKTFPLVFFGIFVTHCPHLRSLETNARIDASGIQSAGISTMSSLTPNVSLETSDHLASQPDGLDFTMFEGSDIEKPNEVARWIYDISHPKLVRLTFYPTHKPKSSDHRGAWESVQRELEALYRASGQSMDEQRMVLDN